MADNKKASAIRSITIKGTWYDHFADLWYEYPRRARRDSSQIPSICLRGHWILEAGFLVGDKLEVRVSGNSITLTAQGKA